jgi:hypothetical protein
MPAIRKRKNDERHEGRPENPQRDELIAHAAVSELLRLKMRLKL